MEDVMEWDPSVLKIDFWSPHFYPPYSPWRSVSFNSALQNVTNDIIWISNNCPLPWIIGETGFVAEDAADTVILVWGTEAEQANYAAQTLDTIRNAGGSGYSWWMFQHVFWEPELPLSIHNHYPPGTDDYYLDVGHYYQNNFGLLGPGEPNSYPTIEKPVVSIFQNYLDPTTQQPPTQGPPLVPNNYGTTGGNPPSQNSITAVIVDQDTVPIKDAVIQGWNKVKILQLDDPTTEDTADFYYPILFNCQFTFTDLTGRFTFTPYDYISPIENDLITKLKISCISGEEYVVCLTDFPNNSLIRRDTMNPYQLGDTIFLKRNLSGYIDTVSNKIINFCPPAENFSALNKLVIEDVTVVGDGTHGGMSDMTARNMIQVNPEFYAQKASKVHLFLSNVFRDCNSLSPFKSSWLNGFTPDIQQNEYNEREIDLAFMKEGNNISAYPNPTSGLFTLEIHTENSSLFKVKIMNMFGSQIKQMSIINSSLIDLSSYPKGVYGITVYSENILLGSCKIVLK
jgi:hypothetical protein